jgi:hypothetical protein
VNREGSSAFRGAVPAKTVGAEGPHVRFATGALGDDRKAAAPVALIAAVAEAERVDAGARVAAPAFVRVSSESSGFSLLSHGAQSIALGADLGPKFQLIRST